MSQKIKFKKLHIPKNNRKNETSNSTRVSRFFSQPSSTNNDEEVQSSNVTQSQNTKSANFVTEQINFSTTNNTDQSKNVSETENLPQHQENSAGNSKTNLETTTATSKTRKTTIRKFFDESSDTDFEISAKQQKKTFSSKISYQEKKNKLKNRKRQPKINNMLLRNEMILSKMLVEQSLAENVNPDEMQLALVLSRSEIEINHSDCKENNTEQTTEDSPMNIQKKLKKYEFKPFSRCDDTDNFPFLIFTKSKTKWANKFTPLTLRNPHKQSQKIHENIDKLLNQQENQILFTKKEGEEEEEENTNKQNRFILTSELLINQKSEENYIFDKSTLEDLNCAQNYYVTDLFTPSKVKAGHLLRDYGKIPGRDLSPINSNKTFECDEKNQLHKNIDSDTTTTCTPSSSSNRIISPELSLPNSSTQITLDKNYENGKSERSREQSPDLFDDYDDTEMHVEDTVNQVKNSSEIEKLQENDIENDEETLNVYEKFSSDEDDKKFQLEVCSKQSIINNNDKDKDKELKENIEDLKLPIKILEICKTNHRKLSNKEMQTGTTTEFNSEVNIIDLTDDCSEDDVDNEECIYDDRDEIVFSQELRFTDSPENDEPDMDNEQFIDNDRDEIVFSQELRFTDSPENDEPDVDNEQFIDNDRDEIVFSQELRFTDSPENDESPIVIDSDEDDLQNSIQNEDNAFQNDELLKEHSKKPQSQKECTNFSKNSTNNSQRIEENCSQKSFVNDDYDVIILSDDEINYSIRRTNNKIFESNIDDEYDIMSSNADSKCDRINENSNFENNFEQDCSKLHNFSLLDLISVNNKIDLELDGKNENAEDNEDNENQEKIIIDEIQSKETNKDESYKNKKKVEIACHQEDEIFNESFFDLKKLKAQFGILDENISTKLNENEIKHPRTELFKTSSYRKSLSESFTKLSPSFLNENKTKSFQQFQRNSNKFKEFISEDGFDDFDEFDKMVYGSAERKTDKSQKCPENLDQLITGKINITPDVKQNTSEMKEIFCDGKMYLMKTENVPEKPDFRYMDSPTRLKELYKYGLKPLKKKQAIIMLEYIYNQTHPFIENYPIEKQQNNFEERGFIEKQNLSDEENLIDKEKKYNKFKLKNSFGDVLLKEDEIAPECDKEEYYFPTNVRSKVSTAVLPLHLAWFNLVKSSNTLREALLHYEPIDLQEIYLFFKGLGYRYNPKDMKKFFDSRCIIFRYDLNEGNNNRHVKKLFTKKNKNCVM